MYENLQLKDNLKNTIETVKLLEEKIERSETQAVANFKKLDSEAKSLKSVIKNNNQEISQLKSELNSSTKLRLN